MGRILTSPGGGSVDDVKVGGVSVVKDKVAEIPEIPTKLDFVPYENAQRDIELGDKILSAGISITEDGVTTGYTTSLYPQSISVGASVKKSGEFFPSNQKNVELKPDGMVFTGSTPSSSSITVTPEYSKDEDFDHLAFIVKNYNLQQGFAKLKVGEPTEDSHAATKKYVDTKIAEVPSVDASNLVPYTGATKDIDLGDHAINFNTSGSVGDLSGSAIINIGKFAGGTGLVPGVYIKTEAHSADFSLRDNFDLSVGPTGLSIHADHEDYDGDTGNNSASFEVRPDGLSIQKGPDTVVKITADKVTGLTLPTDGKDAASKQYVDETISALTIPVIKRFEADITIPEIPVGGKVLFSLDFTVVSSNLETPPSGKQWKLMSQSILIESSGAHQYTYVSILGAQLITDKFDYAPGGFASFPGATEPVPEKSTKIIVYYILENK